MPLIIVSGYPSSGKTERAKEILDFLTKTNQLPAVLLNEETLQINKAEALKDYTSEKVLRSQLKSCVEKNLNQKTFVIIDSLNYIKGCRYELTCIAKTCKTTHCVVFCNTSYETCVQYSQKNPTGIPQEMLKNIIKLSIIRFDDYYKRMEHPSLKNNPLFNLRESSQTPLDEILKALLYPDKAQKYSVSTQPEQKMETDFLFELDKCVSKIITGILEKQNENFLQGVAFTFESCTKPLKLKQTLSLLELKKFKQEFMSLCKQSPPKSLDKIGDTFISFIQTAIERL